ncbi:MAG: sterol desaturase family protein [Bdellovibrionota bacterium]|nr:sterol desaturase family protein [Bdellovibrionota bacterium]
MGKVFDLYFGHWTIWVYWGLAVKFGVLLWLTRGYEAFAVTSLIVIVLAPFAEWLLHKYVLHMEADPDNEYMEKLHIGHHREPKRVELFFAPLSAGLILPFISFFLTLILTARLEWAIAFSLSTILYFLFYEWIHLAHHVDEYKPKTSWGKKLKKAHQWHHYKNENYWWGITSSLGDDILKTFPNPQDIIKSESVMDLEKR